LPSTSQWRQVLGFSYETTAFRTYTHASSSIKVRNMLQMPTQQSTKYRKIQLVLVN